MFLPLADAKPRSKKDRELAIRSVFGEGKVDDETVKYYLKNNLFLAKKHLSKPSARLRQE